MSTYIVSSLLEYAHLCHVLTKCHCHSPNCQNSADFKYLTWHYIPEIAVYNHGSPLIFCLLKMALTKNKNKLFFDLKYRGLTRGVGGRSEVPFCGDLDLKPEAHSVPTQSWNAFFPASSVPFSCPSQSQLDRSLMIGWRKNLKPWKGALSIHFRVCLHYRAHLLT